MDGQPARLDVPAADSSSNRTPAWAIIQLETIVRAAHGRCHADIERAFADLSNIGGLFVLPPFVRRLKRVKRWVRVKLLLYHLTLFIRRPVSS